MSLERVLKALENFGLSRTESEVYVYLAKAGPSRAKDLRDGLRMAKQQLYPTLRSLKKKGIVKKKPERSALFRVLAFEELIERYMKLSAEKTKTLNEEKQELAKSWRTITAKDNS